MSICITINENLQTTAQRQTTFLYFPNFNHKIPDNLQL